MPAGSMHKPPRVRLLLPLLLLVCLPHTTLAERLPVKTYNVADGLQRDNVVRIRQDSRGFLWFCTAEGISRFDGVGMTNFTVADGLPASPVEDFLETSGGTIYIATSRGLARLNPYGLRGSKETPLFTTFLPDNPKAEIIQTLYEDRSKQVWVGTSDGLYKLFEAGGRVAFESVTLGEPLGSSGGPMALPNPNALSIKAILEDSHGTLWVGSYGGGLFRRSPDGNVRRYTGDDVLRDNKINQLFEDRGGRLWMGLRSDIRGGLCLLDEADVVNPVRRCYTTKDGLGSNWIRDILETSDGQLWVATLPGLCRWQGEGGGSPVCKTYTAANGLCDEIHALAEDKDGNLWAGSPCGAQKIARYGFTTYSLPDGSDPGFKVNSIFENGAGELFVSTFRAENVVGRFDGEKFSLVKPPLPAYVDYHGWGWQQTVWQDSRGAWWIPTGYGVFRSPDHTSFENLARAPLEKQDTGARGREALEGGAHEAFRVFEDSRGDVWVVITGWTNRLLRWERAANVWHDHTKQVGFSKYRAGTAFVEDKHGNVWLGASSDHNDSALIRYRDGEFRVLTEAEGAPPGWVDDLFLDSRGRLWIASNKSGVWRLDETDSDRFEFVKYTPANGLTSSAAACVAEDEFGRIYIGTWRGIDRLTPDTGQVENFTTADGLPSSYVESAYRDRQNNLWFATDRGLTRFHPEPVRQRKPPTILITGLRVEGEPQSVSILGDTEIPRLDLNPDQRQVTVDFIGLGASPGEKLRYEYRFGQSAWTPTSERTLNFANLAPGAYRFEVRAVTADRLLSPAPAVISFRIAAPVWQRAWFVALLLLAAGLAAYTLYRYRVARLLEVADMRTRISTDLHDDIGADLTKIALLSEVARRQLGESADQSEGPLSSIARISREAVATMSDIVWAINPQRDSLRDLVSRMRRHAEEVFALGDIKLSFNAPEDGRHLRLNVDVRRDLFLIFKEALNNAVRHSGCTRVEIELWAEGTGLCLRVCDDGAGFDTSAEGEGHGLMSMRRRAEELGGRLDVESGAGRGTTVTFKTQRTRTRRPWQRPTYPV